jgi:hypothetical protein
MEKFERVRITKNLERSKTKNMYDLDDDGYMLKMAGRIYDIKFSTEFFKTRISIDIWCEQAGRAFMFSTDDLQLVSDEELSPVPKPETFNPEQLDI